MDDLFDRHLEDREVCVHDFCVLFVVAGGDGVFWACVDGCVVRVVCCMGCGVWVQCVHVCVLGVTLP